MGLTYVGPAQALEGLQAIHDAGLVHRDIKPDNIILSESRSSPRGGAGSRVPKICDFGMAKGRRAESSGKAMASADMMTQVDMVMGSPEYMAPEQWAGVEARIGVQADVWAIGATLFHLLSGRPPYEAPLGQPRRNIIGQVLYRLVLPFPVACCSLPSLRRVGGNRQRCSHRLTSPFVALVALRCMCLFANAVISLPRV